MESFFYGDELRAAFQSSGWKLLEGDPIEITETTTEDGPAVLTAEVCVDHIDVPQTIEKVGEWKVLSGQWDPLTHTARMVLELVAHRYQGERICRKKRKRASRKR